MGYEPLFLLCVSDYMGASFIKHELIGTHTHSQITWGVVKLHYSGVFEKLIFQLP